MIGSGPVPLVAMAKSGRSLSAFDVACRWLARAPRSVAEVRARLAEIGFSPKAVGDAMARLVHLGFVNDEALAQSRAEALAGRGYGDLWIERDLGRRGLAGAVVTAALAALPREEERARAWLAGTRGRSGRRALARWRALAQRGFSLQTVERLLGAEGVEDRPEELPDVLPDAPFPDTCSSGPASKGRKLGVANRRRRR
jgi:SOS response regulatory protein OraA/RecX